ncbi:MAG: hypothetical protein D6790_06490 [Caldilineae bacterium]|nr:MAG: hypothetical protein D6790_06490 [Caldilineae bacterium]
MIYIVREQHNKVKPIIWALKTRKEGVDRMIEVCDFITNGTAFVYQEEQQTIIRDEAGEAIWQSDRGDDLQPVEEVRYDGKTYYVVDVPPDLAKMLDRVDCVLDARRLNDFLDTGMEVQEVTGFEARDYGVLFENMAKAEQYRDPVYGGLAAVWLPPMVIFVETFD